MSVTSMTLYCLNFPNGKRYFGISINYHKRMIRHKYQAKRGIKKWPLYEAIRKYGWESVVVEVILVGDPLEISLRESEYISQYQTNTREFGYNISSGGTAPMLGRKHSEETKAKWLGRKSPSYWKGKTFSDEHREKMSIARKKLPSPSKGCKWSDESRMKIQKITDEQVELIKRDPRVQSLIAKEYGIGQSQVSRIKRGKRRNARF